MLSAVNGNILQEVYYEKVGKVLYLMGTFLLYAGIFVCSAGKIEQFISETMAERRAQNAREAVKTEAKSEIQQIVLPESKLSAKTKSLKSRSYRYDKTGRLVSVICEACPELNESYVYDKQGNILEKRAGDKTYTFKYDTANQLASMESAEGLREYVYDMAGRLIEEKLNDKTDVKYTYGYLDKVTEVNRRGKITKFVYDGTGMLASKISPDGKVENWMWDGLALIRRGKDIHVNEPHISGGVPIVSRTPSGTQFHESDFLGTTLWSIDSKGNVVSFQNDTIFGEGAIKTNRCARFTGKPYDEDLQAFVFPYRNYDEKSARWRSADPAGYPDGLNQHFYAAVPTLEIDTMGLEIIIYGDITITPSDGSMYTIENQPTSFNASLKIKFTGEDKILAKNGKFGFGLTLDSINIVSANPRIITEETTFLDAAINIAYEGNRALDIGDHILSAFIENRITGGKSDLITSKFSIEK